MTKLLELLDSVLELIGFDFEIWRARRAARKTSQAVHEKFEPKIRAAKKEKKHDEHKNLLAELSYEDSLIFYPLYSKESDHSVRRAQRYNIVVPRRSTIPTEMEKVDAEVDEGKSYWDYSPTTGDTFLTDYGKRQLELQIRDERKARFDGWGRWISLFVGMLGAATGLVVVLQWRVMNQQLDEMKASNDLARQAMEVSERAWVGLKSITLLEKLSPGKAPRVSVVIENGGHSPALETMVRVILIATDEVFPKNPPYPDSGTQGRSAVFAPGATHYLEIQNGPLLTLQEVKYFNNGQSKLFVYGFAEYKDIFGKGHKTTFCGEYVPGQLGLVVCTGYSSAN